MIANSIPSFTPSSAGFSAEFSAGFSSGTPFTGSADSGGGGVLGFGC